MAIANTHNLRADASTATTRPYGIRVNLKAGDPFLNLFGADWSRTHWYPTVAERDARLTEMSRRHEYSRSTDAPALVFTKIENPSGNRL